MDLDIFKIDTGIAETEPVQVCADREAALVQVLEDFLLVAVFRHLVVVPSKFERRERHTFTRITTLTSDWVVLATALFITLRVNPYELFRR